MEETVKRIQTLARMAFVLSIGALMLGFIAVLLSWIAPNEDAKGVPLLLLAPGIALLIAGIFLLVKALRAQGDSWQDIYRSCITPMRVIALVTFLAVAVLVVVFIVQGSSALQLVLVALIAVQAPLALLATSRQMKRAISD